MRARGYSTGFSLVELSIVLVILGLLTGGILAGQSLIRASELRALNTQVDKIIVARTTFRDKYFMTAGDMTNATSFWGSVAGNSSDNFTTTCYSTPSTDARTCNGNGDGAINWAAGGAEELRAWQHLANAGLIEGQYTGYSAASYSAGVTSPSTRLDNFSYFRSNSSLTGGTSLFTANYGNAIWPNPASVLLPEEAWNIDTKRDDGIPATGSVIGYKGNATNACTNRANQAVDLALDAAATYALTNTNKICMPIFVRVP